MSPTNKPKNKHKHEKNDSRKAQAATSKMPKLTKAASQPPQVSAPPPRSVATKPTATRLSSSIRNKLKSENKSMFVAPPSEIPVVDRVKWTEKCLAGTPAATKDATAVLWSGSAFVVLSYTTTVARDRALRLSMKESFAYEGQQLPLVLRPFGERADGDLPTVWSMDFPYPPGETELTKIIRAIRDLQDNQADRGFVVRPVINSFGIFAGRIIVWYVQAILHILLKHATH